jgi:hypothetical protein
MTCIFREIVAGRAPASFVHRDDRVSAFMTLQPTAPGECCVIPNAHIDHFTNVPDPIAAHIMTVAQSIGRRMRRASSLQRVGYLVHGYGVAHALSVREFAGIEAYSGTTVPAAYNMTGSACGVLLFWTRERIP